MDDIIKQVERIRRERDWDKFHTPKNIAISLSVEASELLEIFRWKTDDESRSLDESELVKAKSEIGDIIFNLANICDLLGIDAMQAGLAKAEEIEAKYKVKKFRGSPRKYDST
jgi:dCTP diphosphatase